MAYINGNEILFSAAVTPVSATVVQTTGNSTEYVMSQKAVTDAVTRNSKRISNIEQKIAPEFFSTDATAAYVKSVPANALPYAEITKIGGMSRKAKNIFDISKVTYGKNAGGDTGIPYRAVSAIIPHKYPMYIKVNNLPSNMHYEINYHSANEYSYSAFVSASGWIEDTEVHTTQPYENANYIIILFGAIDNASTVTKEDIEAMRLQIEYTEIGAYEPYFEGLRHAKPTAFKSVGANKFNPQWLLDAYPTVTKTPNEFYGGQASWFYAAYGLDNKNVPFVEEFKENTAYTIQFEGYNNNLNVATFGFQYFYTDGTADYTPFISSTTNAKYSKVTDSTKTLKAIKMTYAENDDIYLRNICIIEGDVTEYVPYKENTLAIPTAVQAIDGYGYGVNANAYNHIEWKPDEGKKKFNKVVKKGIISNIFKPENAYENIQYFGFIKPTDFIGYNSTSSAFIIDGFVTRVGSSDWDNSAHIGTATGEASWGDMWVGFPIGTTLDEAKAALEGKEWLYELATPEVTDISHILTDDNFIAVEGGGTITAVNEYGYDLPSEITYQLEVAQ